MISNKILNVGFLSPSAEQHRSLRLQKTPLMVNPTPYYLHGYFRKTYPDHANSIIWKPSILFKIPENEILAYLEEYDIDILCASIYVWNEQYILNVLKNIKEKYSKKLIIVVGGPSCDAHKEEDWDTEYPFVDHFVVGQGEKAWANLALNYLGVQPLSETSTNIVHFIKKNDTVKINKHYEYEFIRGIHYSPFMECEDMIHELQKKYHEYEFAWPYETQRGCPYQCTFCDWNGGQSNKVQKRKEVNFIDEIDFMAKNKMYHLHISDANFGMWDIDLEIMKRMVYHNVNNQGRFNFVTFNLSKIMNKNFKEIYRLMIEHNFNTYWVKLSIQDIHKTVLDAIDRPGTWSEAKQFGLELYEEFYERKKLNKIFVELILGLPGQTVESYIETLDEFYGNGFIPRTYPFLLLRNAPATYDTEYRAKWGIKNELVYETMDLALVGEFIQ